jgi:hypothetical protein
MPIQTIQPGKSASLQANACGFLGVDGTLSGEAIAHEIALCKAAYFW